MPYKIEIVSKQFHNNKLENGSFNVTKFNYETNNVKQLVNSVISIEFSVVQC